MELVDSVAVAADARGLVRMELGQLVTPKADLLSEVYKDYCPIPAVRVVLPSMATTSKTGRQGDIPSVNTIISPNGL